MKSKKNSYLEYYKFVIEKVSFDPQLVEKEYKKAQISLSAQELPELNVWLTAKGIRLISTSMITCDRGKKIYGSSSQLLGHNNATDTRRRMDSIKLSGCFAYLFIAYILFCIVAYMGAGPTLHDRRH